MTVLLQYLRSLVRLMFRNVIAVCRSRRYLVIVLVLVILWIASKYKHDRRIVTGNWTYVLTFLDHKQYWSHIATHLVLLVGATSSKMPKSYDVPNGIVMKFGGMFLSKYASIDGVGFSIWRHKFNMAAMTSFRAEKCRHVVNAHAASARHIAYREQRPPAPTP